MAVDLTAINVHNRRFLLLFLLVSALILLIFQNAERDNRLGLPLFDKKALISPVYQGVASLRKSFQIPVHEYYIFHYSAEDYSCFTTCQRLADRMLSDDIFLINGLCALFYGYFLARYWQWQYRASNIPESIGLSQTLYRMIAAMAMALMFVHLAFYLVFFLAKVLLPTDLLISQTDLFYAIACVAILGLTAKFAFELLRKSQAIALTQEGGLPQAARLFALAWVIIAFWVIPVTQYSIKIL